MKNFSLSAVVTGEPLTMTSREIAELTGKEHRNVMRDIRAMLVELYGEGGVLGFEHTLVNPQNGQSYPIFRLPKRETYILVAGYKVKMRAAIIDRWQQLEDTQKASVAVAVASPVSVLADSVDRGLLTKRSAQGILKAWIFAQHPGIQSAMNVAAKPSPSTKKSSKSKPDPKHPVRTKLIPPGGLEGCNFVVGEIAEYVVGGAQELSRAMREFGLVDNNGTPTAKSRGLVTHKSPNGYHWKVAALLRVLSGCH